MAKFAVVDAPDRDWRGLHREVRAGQLAVTAICDWGARDERTDRRPLPPIFWVKAFQKAGWAYQHRRPVCPACQKREKQVATKPTIRAALPQFVGQGNATPAPSDAAKEARRLAYTAIEDAYDEKAKAYRPGHSDASIAKEVGLSEAQIGKIREEFFGPAGMPIPPAIAKVIDEWAGQAAHLAALSEQIERATESLRHLRAQLDSAIAANGWRT